MVTIVRLTRFCPEERRDSIIAVAAEVFAQEGYGATSMSTIASRLGGSKATLYKYFPSKEHLFEAVMQQRCEGVLAPLRDLRGSDSDDLETLLAGFGAQFLTKIYESSTLDVQRLIQSEGPRFPELAEAFFRAGPDAVIEELCATLMRFVARGQIACDDVTLAAGQFLGMLRGDRHLRFSLGLLPAPAPDEIDYHARYAARIFVHGLMPRAPDTRSTTGTW
jgi:AcrR family transcriptional regulator